MLNITTGKKMYEDRSVSLQCFIFDPNQRKECSIFSYLRRKPNHGTIEGLDVQATGYSKARDGITVEAGGYWSTTSVKVETELLMKLHMVEKNPMSSRSASVYFIVRPGSQVGILEFNRVPDRVMRDVGYFGYTSLQALSGGFELTSIDDAEIKYGISVSPLYRQLSLPVNYQYFVRHSIIREASVKEPVVRRNEIVLGTGEVIQVAKRIRRHRNIGL